MRLYVAILVCLGGLATYALLRYQPNGRPQETDPERIEWWVREDGIAGLPDVGEVTALGRVVRRAMTYNDLTHRYDVSYEFADRPRAEAGDR